MSCWGDSRNRLLMGGDTIPVSRRLLVVVENPLGLKSSKWCRDCRILSHSLVLDGLCQGKLWASQKEESVAPVGFLPSNTHYTHTPHRPTVSSWYASFLLSSLSKLDAHYSSGILTWKAYGWSGSCKTWMSHMVDSNLALWSYNYNMKI